MQSTISSCILIKYISGGGVPPKITSFSLKHFFTNGVDAVWINSVVRSFANSFTYFSSVFFCLYFFSFSWFTLPSHFFCFGRSWFVMYSIVTCMRKKVCLIFFYLMFLYSCVSRKIFELSKAIAIFLFLCLYVDLSIICQKS